MYLWQGNKDTLYRIHGTVEPWTIGKSVSSGCIRMINQDVIDLYRRAPVVDGLRVGDHVLVAAIGIDGAGDKHVLALALGATENTAPSPRLPEGAPTRSLYCPAPCCLANTRIE
jgi:hypothetical protein